MRTTHFLLSILLSISFLTGCYTKYKRKIEEQERLISEKQALISDLERKQKELGVELTQNETLKEELHNRIGTLEDSKKILLQQIDDRTLITLPNAILFSSGSTILSKRGVKTLKTICEVLEKYPDHPICIEGHTDSVSISPRLKEKYATNWELSIARAIHVMSFMVGRFKIEQNRVSVKGYGPFQPIASNATPEGRAENRRVVIVVESKR